MTGQTEDRWGRFQRDWNIDLKAINDAAFGGTVDLSDYYTKTDVDSALASKANITALTNFYDRMTVDTLLNDKVNDEELINYYTKAEVDQAITDVNTGGTVDLSNYYNKQQIDTALSSKANTSDLATKANQTDLDALTTVVDGKLDSTVISSYYTKTQVDTALSTKTDSSALTAHTSNTSNPHSVTKTQVGLGNVDNTADTAKPISTATQTALNAKADTTTLTAHTSNTANPHAVTKAQVGLGNVDNTSDVNKPVSTAQQSAIDAVKRVSTFAALQSAIANANVTEIQVDGNSAIAITSTLNITRALKIIGGSFTVASGAGFKITASDVELNGLTINGPSGSTYDSAQKLVYAQGTSAAPLSRIAVRNCRFKGSNGDNVWLEWCIDSSVTNNIITNFLYSAIMVISGTRVMVANNIVRDAALSTGVVNVYGIAFTDIDNTTTARSKNCSAVGNHVSFIDWEGIDTHGGDGITISGNTVIACPRGIALVTGNETRLTSPTRCVVTGNTIDGTGVRSAIREGIVLAGISGVTANGTITGNHITNHSTPFLLDFVDRASILVSNNNYAFVPWTSITMDGDFTSSGTWTPQYMVDGNTVYIRGGVIPKTTSPRPVTIGHIDSAFAKPEILTFVCLTKGSGSSNNFCYVSIDTDGSLKANYWTGTADTFTYFLSGSYQAV